MSTQHVQIKVPLSFKQIKEIVRQLSPEEKLQLSSILWDEADEKHIDIPEGHKKIVINRLKRMDKEPESCLNWDDIEHKIKL